MSSYRPNIILYALLAIMCPLTVWLHSQISKPQAASGSSSVISLPSPKALRLVALGYDRLVADFFWIAFINYIGDVESREVDHYYLADQYLDIITGLDPHFLQAYWFCAFTVGYDQKRPLRAHELIERGIAANPDNWHLPYIAGLNLFLFGNDEKSASKYYLLAGRFEGAPRWLRSHGKLLAAKIPSLIKQVATWEQVYKYDDGPLIRAKAKTKLIELWSAIYARSAHDATRQRAEQELARFGARLWTD